MLMAQFVIALDLIRLSVKTSDSVHAATIVINEFYINKTGRKLIMSKKNLRQVVNYLKWNINLQSFYEHAKTGLTNILL